MKFRGNKLANKRFYGGNKMITPERSREIFWKAVKSALELPMVPESLEQFFIETSYKNLFVEWVGEFGWADVKIAKSVIREYKKAGFEIMFNSAKIQVNSKVIRERKSENNKITNFFDFIHKGIWALD